jgi:hypothetical protein
MICFDPVKYFILLIDNRLGKVVDNYLSLHNKKNGKICFNDFLV